MITSHPRRKPGVSIHDHHHYLIALDLADWENAPKGNGVNQVRRREAYKRAVWNLQGHLSGCHGFKRMVGPPLSLEALQARHEAYHADETR